MSITPSPFPRSGTQGQGVIGVKGEMETLVSTHFFTVFLFFFKEKKKKLLVSFQIFPSF
jgi:hypothetical protein